MYLKLKLPEDWVVGYFALCVHKYVNPPAINTTPTIAVLEKNSLWERRINTTPPVITLATANKESKTFIVYTAGCFSAWALSLPAPSNK